MGQETLLVLLPFTPSPSQIAKWQNVSPGYTVITLQTEMYGSELPESITNETWSSVTVLFTWKLLPEKHQVPNLKYVQLLSAGCNQLFGRSIFEETSDVAFCTSNGVHPPQIAEWVFATFLAWQHHVPKYLELQAQSKWVDPDGDEDTEDAVGLRVGILGYGCVGRQVARVSKALGMDVYAYTLHERATAESRRDDSYTEPGLGDPEGRFPSKWFHGKDQLNDFLKSNLDLLVITLPGTAATKDMIAAEQFDLLSSKKTYVTNAGRGSIINTNDLIQALEQGKIRGAALDVTDPEPLPEDHPLWKAPNVIITPHCAGNSNHYYERVQNILSYNLERRSQGKTVVNMVDRKLGY